MKKRLLTLLIVIMFLAGVVGAGHAYFGFVSRTIYEESTAHLIEIFHQANQTLSNMVSISWSRMRMWVPHLQDAESEAEIIEYVNQARLECNFTDFYFISRDGEYITTDGEKGYLDFRKELSTLILEKQPVVANSVVPDKPEIMVFAIPAEHGYYRDFEYEAIAITYNNADMVEALKITAFEGDASTFAVLPDGRIVLDNSNKDLMNTHNILALLENCSDLNEEDIAALHENFLSEIPGEIEFKLNGKKYYFIYEPVNFENWTILGIVPANVVNSSMNKLQTLTIYVVSGIIIALAVMLLILVIQQNRQKLKRKDKELLARDELFSKISINVDDIFLMLNASNLHVEYVSPNIEKLVGISEQRVYDNIYEIENLIKSDESVHILDQLSDMQPGEHNEWDREYIHQKSGETLWFRVFAFCSDIQGEKKYILDLSDRTMDKKNNQELEEAVYNAENANRAKTSFLNNMSHDIRTPMNAIIGFTNIALKQEMKPEVRDCLNKICDSSEHLLTLINDVLDISRIESGKTRFTPVPVDITTVVDVVLDITRVFLSNRNIAFEVIRNKNDNPYVIADAVRIREVLVNILGNAVKFTNDGGMITFEASNYPGVDDRHIVIQYRVTDTGIGMTEEFVNHIFDEFSQEESSARTHYKGTGLGMAITKSYVDLMEGTITVESEKGKGSTFIVEIPVEITDESAVQRRETTVSDINLKNIRVLLAEDNDLNAEIAIMQLEELGMIVRRVVNGKEALELFCNSKPNTFDVILMDIMMPEMNGYEATMAIRSLEDHPEAQTIPIIAMTANAFAEDIQTSMDAGMNGHLSKPIVIEDVIKAIARNLIR